MSDHFEDALDSIEAERKEILAAFIAKYKCEPDDVEQVHRMSREGVVWFIRRRRARGQSCDWSMNLGFFDTSCGLKPRMPLVPDKCPNCKLEITVLAPGGTKL